MDKPEIKICMHVSATTENSYYPFDQCRFDHINVRGWSDIGYNLYIERSGKVGFGRKFGSQLAHARGHNKGWIAICTEGGLDKNGNPKDTRTYEQRRMILQWILAIKTIYKVIDICGHRDLSPDVNHDGVITPDEWMKDCPCYDVRDEYSWLIG